MDLPPELRVMIWKYLLVLDQDQIEIRSYPPYGFSSSTAKSREFRQKRVIAVLRTSSVIYYETMPIFYHYNTLYFRYGRDFEKFVKHHNPKSRQFITSIRLDLIGSTPKALVLCEQLRYLQLDMYEGDPELEQLHERHWAGSSGMKDLAKLRGLISVKVLEFREDIEEDELIYSIDLQEYRRRFTASKVSKQPKVLHTKPPVRPVARKQALATRRQPERAVKGKRTNP
ncbi:hypothetical protein MMC22_009117 [Lobaria immixta]|nr:hypothetical protein [Lobaria immixta]